LEASQGVRSENGGALFETANGDRHL